MSGERIEAHLSRVLVVRNVDPLVVGQTNPECRGSSHDPQSPKTNGMPVEAVGGLRRRRDDLTMPDHVAFHSAECLTPR